MLDTMQKRTILEREAARNIRKAKAAEEKFRVTGSPYSKTAAETRRFLAEACHREASVCGDEDEYACVLISAVRFALPSQSPSGEAVRHFVCQNLPHLSAKSLSVLLSCLEDARRESGKGGAHPYAMGSQQIDRPRWLNFMESVRAEYRKKTEKEGAQAV